MTDTTDIEALRRRSNNLRTADQTDAFIDLLLGKLEAERQRADDGLRLLEEARQVISQRNGECDRLINEIESIQVALNEVRKQGEIWERDARHANAELAALKGDQVPVALTVWYGSMPESNGKENWTAILHRKGEGKLDGITIDRSEYPGRVLYAADRARYLIGEKEDRPHVLSYDGDKRSDYVYPITAPQKPVVLPAKKQWTSFYHEGDPNHCPAHYRNEGYLLGIFEMKQAIEAAGGIVKDGE